MVIYKFEKMLLARKLKERFGKDTFTEDELTKEFYTELRIQCGEFFNDSDGVFMHDLFLSDNFRDWLLKEK
jgi:hypothetical protein